MAELVHTAITVDRLLAGAARRDCGAIALFLGIAAALAFEGLKHGFALYVKNVSAYEVVYGTLSALPVFLIWIYVCWLIVLSGAAVTATLTLAADAAPGTPARSPRDGAAARPVQSAARKR